MFRSHTLAALSFLAIIPVVSEVRAQETAASAVAAAAPAVAAPAAAAPAAIPAAAAVTPRPSIWSFLGVPQTARGLRTLRSRVVNRRGNFPGLERKPPMLPLTAAENLESPNPAIKAAAEIKKAEDMKMQKIKAIKYLASLGCGCYDKDGKITDAMLAATDDCTPDVRLAAIEAVEDNVNKSCCKSCGTTSCCNEKISKRLSEMAYERDDEGCPIEASAEIRRAAARVLKKCCPGGLYTGPIEEELQEIDESAPVEMIPAPEPNSAPEPEEIRGESSDEDDTISGESGDESSEQEGMNLDDNLDNPFEDGDSEGLDAPEADAEDLILRRVHRGRPIEYHLDNSITRTENLRAAAIANSSQLVPVLVESRKSELHHRETLQLNAATPAASAYAKPVQRSRSQRIIEATPVSVIRKSKRVHVQPPANKLPLKVQPMKLQPVPPMPMSKPKGAAVSVPRHEPTARSPRSMRVAKSTPLNEPPTLVRPTTFMKNIEVPTPSIIEPQLMAQPASGHRRSSTQNETAFDPNLHFSAFGDIVSVNQNTGQVLLKPLKRQGIRVGVRAEVIRFSPQGSRVLGTVNVKIVGRTIVTAQINDPNLLSQIQSTDKFVCRY